VIFEPAEIDGAFLVSMEPRGDERGWFARAWCEDEFRAVGVDVRAVQTNVSFNVHRGTIRGLHWQVEPYGETKLIRCTAGEVFDVAADVRPGSPTYGRWQGVHLRAGDRKLVFVPAGCAHGYQSLSDGAEVSYQVSHPYVPGAEQGIRWDDPAFGIEWPLPEPIVSEKDSSWPDFELEVRA
jgi:dTDP-4-dehydrorhamnose 3,5-epimerase